MSEIPPNILVWHAKFQDWPEGEVEEMLESGMTAEKVLDILETRKREGKTE